ncbi:MAG: DUF1156 domain-containing protein [Promethearchaeia archaeon]
MEKHENEQKALIEEWLPFEEIGIECQRERGMSSALPPINYLHVWWARRPLTACKAAILSSILPSTFEYEKFYKLMKFEKDLVKTHRLMMKIKRQGQRSKIGYKKPRVFSLNLSRDEFDELIKDYSLRKLRLLDPMAGGGSIPFESVRLGLNTYVSDINPVACVINYASYYFSIKYRERLIPKIEEFSNLIIRKIKSDLKEYFYSIPNQENQQYIWTRTIKCPNPNCNLIIPLSPNWYLAKKPLIILKIEPPKDTNKTVCKFKIIENPSKDLIKNNPGTIKKGKGFCPRCNYSFSSDYINSEAKDGRMGHQLVAIVYKVKVSKKKEERRFRIPIKEDLVGLKKVDSIISKKIKEWKEKKIFPEEKIMKGLVTKVMINKGVNYWYELFNNRQLLTNMTILEAIIEIKNKLLKEKSLSLEEIRAIITYLQFALDKIIDRNSILCRWQPAYQRIANTFARHDFPFIWSYAEMDIIRKGFDWAISNVLKAYKGILKLLDNYKPIIEINSTPSQNLSYLKDQFIDIIIVDPPYYDNVMYAELSDYFYVWMKKGIGDLYPQLFKNNLTDKDNEAVANISKFEGMGKSKKLLAKQDYEAKMLLSFKEMFRVLKEKGILIVMFTHKSTHAWDVLTMSLMEAGFEITASWPVNTESPISLNIAKKNSVKTTILLVCRKRKIRQEDFWWEDDVLPSIKKIVSKKVKEFQKLGIEGVDLFISCFGPALKEFSKNYPVKNIAGNIVRAEEAIEAARKVVIDITLHKIIKTKSYNIDPVSKFYLIAWHFFKAREFPFDEARRLSLAVGVNIDDLKNNYKILKRKSGDVEILSPIDREKNGMISIDNPNDYGILINAVHISILAYQQGGQKLFERVVEKLRRNTDKSFRLYMETLFNILPDVKDLSVNLPEKKIIGEILINTVEKITPKGGKITDYIK